MAALISFSECESRGVSLLYWFAVHVHSQCEKRVREHLSRLRIESYLPTYFEKSRWTDRTKTVERMLFPGYCFVRCELDQCPDVAEVKGVVRVLGDAHPIAIPDAEVEGVRALIASGAPLTQMRPIQVGKRVVIEHGPFRGVEGIVARVAKQCQFIVTLSIMNRSLGVPMAEEWLRAV